MTKKVLASFVLLLVTMMFTSYPFIIKAQSKSTNQPIDGSITITSYGGYEWKFKDKKGDVNSLPCKNFGILCAGSYVTFDIFSWDVAEFIIGTNDEYFGKGNVIFKVDGKEVKTIEVTFHSEPQKVKIPLTGAQRLRISIQGGSTREVVFCEPILKRNSN